MDGMGLSEKLHLCVKDVVRAGDLAAERYKSPSIGKKRDGGIILTDRTNVLY
jgi:hypothetical protein